MDVATTKPNSSWESRLGRGTAALLLRRRRLLRGSAAAAVIGAAAMASGIAVAASTGSHGVALGTVALVFGFVAVGLVGLISGLSMALAARGARFKAEGAALSVLLPRNPSLTATTIAPNLRSVARYDQWVVQNAVQPAVHGARLPQWQWSPGKVRVVLPGASAFALRRAAGVTMAVEIAATFLVAVLLIADRGPAFGIRLAGGVAIVGLLAVSGVLRLAAERRAAAEYRAGYTTLSPIHHVGLRGSGWVEPDVRTGVDLVDASSHLILRAAGAAGLSVAESARRRQLG